MANIFRGAVAPAGSAAGAVIVCMKLKAK